MAFCCVQYSGRRGNVPRDKLTINDIGKRKKEKDLMLDFDSEAPPSIMAPTVFLNTTNNIPSHAHSRYTLYQGLNKNQTHLSANPPLFSSLATDPNSPDLGRPESTNREGIFSFFSHANHKPRASENKAKHRSFFGFNIGKKKNDEIANLMDNAVDDYI